MTKIYYLILAVIFSMVTACESFNEKNFPGYDLSSVPKNIIHYDYELAISDYIEISNSIKSPIEEKINAQNDSLKKKEIELKNASNSADSIRIQNELDNLKVIVADSITKLKQDSLYVTATSISKNKCFSDSTQFVKEISSFLKNKFIYADTSSTVKVSFKFIIPYDTTTILATNKYELVATDYTEMGIPTSNFSLKTANPNHYLPIWLKVKFPYANIGDIKLVRYMYDNGTTPTNIYKTYKIYLYDGVEWKEYSSISLTNALFTLNDKNWELTSSVTYSESFSTTLGEFISIQESGTKAEWIWASYKGTGYAYANAYKKGAVVLWLVSPEISLPDNPNLILSFKHAINYFNGNMDLTELISVNISTDFNDDVTSATWEKLDIKYPESPSWTFLNSGDVSLTDYANKKIRIGFRYETLQNSQEAWEVNSVVIKEK